MKILVFNAQKTWCLRGDKEPKFLLLDDVEFSKNDQNCTTIELKNLRGAKNGQLSMNILLYSIDFANIISKDPLNTYYVVKVGEFYKNNHLRDEHKGVIFYAKGLCWHTEEKKIFNDPWRGEQQ